MYFEVLVLMFVAIAAYNYRLGLYAIIFLMPAYLFRCAIFGIPATFLEVMIYILFIFWFMQESRRGKPFDKLFILFKKERILSYGIILLFLGLLISTVYSSNVRTSLGIVRGWFIDPLLLFIVFISCIREYKEIRNVLLSWVLSGFTVAVIAIGYLLADRFTFDGRLHAFYLSPNHLAMYLAPALLIAFAILIYNKNFMPSDMREKTEITKLGKYKLRITENGLLIMIFAIITAPLFLTRSYGAFFAVFIAMAGFVCSNKDIDAFKVCSKPKHIMIAGIMLAVVFFAAYGKLTQVYNSNGRSSFHSRLMIWNASWEMIKESPIVGIGPGTFQEKYLSLAKARTGPYLEWAVPQPHNIFLAFYLQTGLVGFIGFILILMWFFQANWKKNENNIQFQISDISACLMIYILVHGLIDTTYWKNDLSLMFWLMLGMMMTAKYHQSLKIKKNNCSQA